MPAFIEKTPNGLETWVDQNEDDEIRHHFRQDVEPILKRNQALRNDGLKDHGIKNDFWHYADIPPVVILKMRFEDGVDVFNKDHQKKVFELLNTKYPYCKTTEKTHTVK